jgi:Flp pilus assembly pilin Flp
MGMIMKKTIAAFLADEGGLTMGEYAGPDA